MEHLMYKPAAREFRLEVRKVAAALERGDWAWEADENDRLLADHPPVRWLNHDHKESSYYSVEHPRPQPRMEVFTIYGEVWDVDNAFESKDLRAAHDSLQNLGDEEVAHHVAAFMQSWLFFGLLEAICCTSIPVEFFTREEDGETYISTRRLPAFLEGWRRLLEANVADTEARHSALRDTRECVGMAQTILAGCLEWDGPFRTAMIAVEPALSPLFDAILSFVGMNLKSNIRYTTSVDFPSSVTCFENLVRKGWCPFAVTNALKIMPLSFMLYVDLAGYKRAGPGWGHEGCTSSECTRNNIDLDTYTQQHWPQRCRCQFIKLDVKLIFKVLDADMIPVLTFSDEEIKVAAVEPDEKARNYIAFSHVWADGLGSCTELGLPICQVRRLQLLAKQADGRSPWFWIDGLCIPKEPSYRRKAIQMMNMTFRGSLGVVILDNGIQSVPRSASDVEIAWTVLTSGWMGRMWTYLEGFQPQRAYLRLSDGFYNLYDLIQALRKLENSRDCGPFPFVLLQELISFLQKARPIDFKHRERAVSRRLVYTFNALTNRSTSRPDDQVLVIGLLLDLDVKCLMKAKGEERWKKLYLSVRELPWTIVFDQRPKMTTAPFRWAPRSWLDRAEDRWLTYEDALAICTPSGLRAKITVLRLHTTCEIREQKLLIKVHQAHDDLDVYYMLWRTSNASAGLLSFNTIFIRSFAHQLPRETLAQNLSMTVDVGIGFLSDADELEYTFEKHWDFYQLPDASHSPGTLTITGEWAESEFLFT